RRHTRFSRDWSSDVCSSDLTGVVAADADGHITVFNQEAVQIAGLNTNGGERTLNDLPAPLRDIIQTTLTSGERQEDREVELAGEIGRASCREECGCGGRGVR